MGFHVWLWPDVCEQNGNLWVVMLWKQEKETRKRERNLRSEWLKYIFDDKCTDYKKKEECCQRELLLSLFKL